jgi:hypothetical protein
MQQMIFIADLITCSTSLGHHYALNLLSTIMPIIRSSIVLYRWLLPVVFGALVFKLLVARNPQTGHITLSSTQYRQFENQSTKYLRQQPSV